MVAPNDDESDDALEAPPVPRPRRPGPIGAAPRPSRAPLVASLMSAGLGVLGLFGATLFLPVHMTTPILSGVSLLMVAKGCVQALKLGREDPSVRLLVRVATAVCSVCVVAIIVVTAVLGAGYFGPDLRPLRPATTPTVTFERGAP